MLGTCCFCEWYHLLFDRLYLQTWHVGSIQLAPIDTTTMLIPFRLRSFAAFRTRGRVVLPPVCRPSVNTNRTSIEKKKNENRFFRHTSPS